MRKRNLRRGGYTLLEIILVLGIVAVLAAILFPLLQRRKEQRKSSLCGTNLYRTSIALRQYAKDYQDRFPLVKVNDVASSVAPFTRPFGWADSLYPYLKDVQFLQCPGENRAANANATKDGFSDYWYNANLNAVSVNAIASPTSNFVFGDYRESNGERVVMNARFHIKSMPLDWLNEDHSATRRHLTNSYLFADGHVAGYRTGYSDLKVH